MEENIQSANINSLWLNNIYENIKNIETYAKFAYNGCKDVMEYLQIPLEIRQKTIADVQYKNLSLMVNELKIVIPDTVPVIGEEKAKEFLNKLNIYSQTLKKRELFIQKVNDAENNIKYNNVTELFEKTLDDASYLRIELILLLKNILYIPEGLLNG